MWSKDEREELREIREELSSFHTFIPQGAELPPCAHPALKGGGGKLGGSSSSSRPRWEDKHTESSALTHHDSCNDTAVNRKEGQKQLTPRGLQGDGSGGWGDVSEEVALGCRGRGHLEQKSSL